MSRIGNQLIEIPQGVTVNINGSKVSVSGEKGQLTVALPKGLKVELEEQKLTVKLTNEEKKMGAIHGLIRSELNNAVLGVSKGWSKTVQLVGVGFRAQTDGQKLTMVVGFSHQVDFMAPSGITFSVKGNDVTISGFDKQLVGETSARIRRIKPPEKYKGKGIRYKGEVIHLKPGKAAKTVGVGAAGK